MCTHVPQLELYDPARILDVLGLSPSRTATTLRAAPTFLPPMQMDLSASDPVAKWLGWGQP